MGTDFRELFVQNVKQHLERFVIGTFASCMDMVFIQQSVSLKTNIARWMYITPPIMMMPVSYTMTQELLGRHLGDRHLTYSLSSLAPAMIWGFFRQSWGRGIRMYIGIAFFTNFLKLNADVGGLLHRPDWLNPENLAGNWRYQKDSHFTSDPRLNQHSGSDFLRRNFGVEPNWKRFADEDE